MRLIVVGTALVLPLAWALPGLAQETDGRAEVIAMYKRAERLKATSKLKEAAHLYENAVAKARVAYGKDDINTANLMYNLALVYKDMGQYAKAEPLLKRGLEIYEAKLGKDHTSVATSLNTLALLYEGKGQYAKAEPLLKRGLEIREARLGKDHPSVAIALNNLALVYKDMGQYAKAEPLLKRGLEIREARLGKDHPDVATSLNNLAGLYQNMGRYAKAESLYKRGLGIYEAKLGKDHPSVAIALNNLAVLYVGMSQYAKAEPLYKRSLAISEARLGKDSLDVALALNNLAGLYQSMGQYAKAEPYDKRSLAIRVAKLGKDHPDVALSLNNLAELYKNMGQYAKAEPLLKRGLEIREARLGKDHPDVATSLNNLAGLYQDMGRYAKAEPLLKRGLGIYEAKLGKDHPSVAIALNNLALLYQDIGQYAKAEPLYKRGLEIREARLGKDHPGVASSLNNLAVLQGRLRRPADAYPLFDRARQSTRRHVSTVLPVLSQAEQLTFLQRKEQGSLEQALSLGMRYQEGEGKSLSASWLANGKAQAAESLARSTLLARGSADPPTARLVAELLSARATLARHALGSPRPGTEAEHARHHEQLVSREQELSRELRQAGSTAVAGDWVDLGQVRQALPRNGILIDLVRMTVYDYQAKPGAKKWRPAHYVAWLTPKEGGVQIVDLGEAKAIDEAVEKLRRTLKEAPKLINSRGEPEAEKSLREPLRKLSDLVLKPLLPHAGKAKNWLVSPDGKLWLVPWQMLLLADGKYTLEKHRIRYLTSGRDAIAPPGAKVAVTPALVLANPDFDLGGAAAESTPGELRGLAGLKLGNIPALPGTAAEARAITPSLKAYTAQAPRILLGKDAAKSALREAKHPRVLVLSTHGFFLPDQPAKEGEKNLPLQNPLLRCGLLLAGCNSKGSQGVLTGLEVLGSDLRGCELVVLSACETGLGDVQSGEGVAGMRQAFQVAGAEAVVSTLWQVPDRQSAQLMSLFFQNLAAGKTKAESLRLAQVKVIEERREDNAAAHPFFWAAFTLTGR